MDKAQLEIAIQKLKQSHLIGSEIREQLELGPSGKQAKDGQVEKAAAVVGKKWKRTIEYERARKLIEFSRKYEKQDLDTLVSQCKEHKYAPELGVLIRLFPLSKTKRNALQKKAIKGRWKKTRLNQEIARRKPKGQLVDPVRRGRRPAAIKSVEALTGEALTDAIKWGRILDFLVQEDGSKAVWEGLTKAQQKDLRSIAKSLSRLSGTSS